MWNETHDFHRAAREAGNAIHENMGAKPKGLDYKQGELKTHWVGHIDESQIRRGINQVVKDAQKRGGSPKPVLHWVVDLRTGKAVQYKIEPSVVLSRGSGGPRRK